MTKQKNKEVFVEITNKDIFNKIEDIKDRLISQDKKLLNIENHVEETNGKVKNNRKMIIGIIVALVGVTTEIVIRVIIGGGLI